MNDFTCPKCLSNTDTINLTSTSISNGFANKYLKKDSVLSPNLSWNPVFGAKSYALLCIDPDAPKEGGWRHWILLNIPASINQLPESKPERNKILTLKINGENYRIIQGKNSWGDYGYGGPAPPPGSGPHRYYFCLYALDIELESYNNNGNKMAEDIEGHVLACGHFMRNYEIS